MDSDDVLKARNAGFSIFAGLLFGAAWWVFIDGFSMGVNVLNDATSNKAAGYAWLPLFGASLVYLMINGMRWSELRDDMVADPRTAAKARIFLIFALFVAMACVAGAVFIMVDKFLSVEGTYAWAGISTVVGTLLILLAAFVQRFGTLPPSDSMY